MNRRAAISKLLQSAAAVTVAPALSSLAAAQTPDEAPAKIIPYGADCLHNTDPEKLGQSLLLQLTAAGLPEPEIYIPFPGQEWGENKPVEIALPFQPLGLPDIFAQNITMLFGTYNLVQSRKWQDEYANSKEIVGTAPQNKDLQNGREFFDSRFKGQPSCGDIPITQAEWNADTALHETGHYVGFNVNRRGWRLQKGQVALADHLYCAVNQAPAAQSRYSLVASLAREHDNHKHDKDIADRLFVAQVLYKQVHERLGDTSAALYSLSNYKDTDKVVDYYERLAHYRTAYFTDTEHDSKTSIQTAVQAFREAPRKGMSIVETTLTAAYVIAGQPEFQRPISKIAEDLHRTQIVVNRMDAGLDIDGRIRGLRKEGELALRKIRGDIMNSRNRLCARELALK